VKGRPLWWSALCVSLLLRFSPGNSDPGIFVQSTFQNTFWRRILVVVCLTALGVAMVGAVGCSGSRDRGKNSDFDRPTTERK